MTSQARCNLLKNPNAPFARQRPCCKQLNKRRQMKVLNELKERIVNRVNVNLRGMNFDVRPLVDISVPLEQFSKFYAFYGLTPYHPLHFHFSNSTLAGSYFLGKCVAEYSMIYKSDVRGDELKEKDNKFVYEGLVIPLHKDEEIRIKDSFLVKTLVHNFSHDPESPEEFLIQNTAAMPYANIHGSPVEGSFLGAFSTIDLTTVHNTVVGEFAYLQTGEMSHHIVSPGQIWISGPHFDFKYRYDPEVLARYVSHEPGKPPKGEFISFIESRERDFEEVFNAVQLSRKLEVPAGASVSHYAVVKGDCTVSENVLVAQRAYLEDAHLGRGANAQENCFIIGSRLAGYNVTGHGAKIIQADMGEAAYVGFNSFLRGKADATLKVGDFCVVMPHTIIDLEESIEVPPKTLVWGFVANAADLAQNSMPLAELGKIETDYTKGKMVFNGSGAEFVHGFGLRIDLVLEANGAYWKEGEKKGHAQSGLDVSFNIVQPYTEGDRKGMYPTIDIRA
jgi:carbonic anhydrase/acetyltransferase-like protein (isoleucine patch superfamily)